MTACSVIQELQEASGRLHGLRARLCDDVDSLDSFLPPRMAALARKVAGVLEEPQPVPV
ncbi:hypothetical protein [Streptomyces jumonjinensis]|uniref:hypothetical protein n=1 Tax=Streptomyces jumonjinensis TaxID=1945 RepID=UPI001297A057|nr:hypothetical protein [Streptomyces jumonjinensis]